MLQPRIDRNVEVVTCLLNLTERGSLDWNTGISSQPYRREVMQHFSHLKKHPAVLLTNQLHAQGFWWDAMIELAVTCTVFPEAALTADLRNSRYVNAGEGDPAKGKKTLDELLDLIDDFLHPSRIRRLLPRTPAPLRRHYSRSRSGLTRRGLAATSHRLLRRR